jgi:hypothetical protein
VFFTEFFVSFAVIKHIPEKNFDFSAIVEWTQFFFLIESVMFLSPICRLDRLVSNLFN